MSNQVALSQGKVAFIHTCKETNVDTTRTMWYVEATLFQEEAHPIRKTAVAVTFWRCFLLLWSYALKNLIFQIPFYRCVSLIRTVMIRLSRCTILLIFHPYVFTVQVKTWATHLQVTIIRCVLTVFDSRDPIKKGSSVLCCIKCCFLLHPVSFDLNWYKPY